MREVRVTPRFAWWRLALLLALAPLVGCHPELDAAKSASRAATACDGEARASIASPPPAPRVVAPDPSPTLGDGDGSGAVTNFGIFTPVFPGAGAQALSTRCDPDDFYGGCL